MTADPTTEHWLREHGAEFELTFIRMSDIDVERSHRNQARIGAAVDTQTTAMYVEALKNGAVFPPVVGYYDDRDFIFIDGNHRHAAYAEMEATTIEAYVVQHPSETQIKMLTWDANTRHGKPTSLSERIEQAAWLVDTGTSGVEAARALNIPVNPLYSVLQRIEVDRRLDSLGFDYSLLPKSTRHTLSRLKLDPVLLRAAQVAHGAKMSSAHTDTMVRAVLTKTTEQDQLDQIAIERAKHEDMIAATANGKRSIPTAFRRLRFVLTVTEAFDPTTIDPTKLDSTGRAALRERATATRTRLDEIITRLA